MSSTNIPAGAVLAYAGTYQTTLSTAGWLFCNGAVMARTADTADLFSAIGTANGGDGVTSFYLPDYRGVFLRGVDDKSKVDPDADARTAVVLGGASGDNCGSFQGYATALPTTGLGVQVIHLPVSEHWAYEAGAKFEVSVWDAEHTNACSCAGGDAESRPENVYVDFIIQQRPKNAAPALPVGVLVPMTLVVQPESGWMLCDGRSLSNVEYPELVSAIGQSHGGTASTFNLPDLRGRFPRGRSASSPRDPDAAQRGAVPGGNQGDNVGSLQTGATGKPIDPFCIKLQHLPVKSGEVGHATGHAEALWNEGSVSITFFGGSAKGGDAETRPVNLSVDWYIKADTSSADLPVGAIIALAGNGSPGPEWLACDGKSYDTSKYPQLYGLIGTLNGGDGIEFNVPDCRGRFLRGVDHGTHRDPDAATREAAASGGTAGDHPGSIQSWASKPPATPITGLVPHLPTGDHKDTAKGSIHTGIHAAASNSGTTTIAVEERSGDHETRPVNIYVRYYIKAK